MAEPVKISYNGTLFRVRCEIAREQCLGSEAPPPDLAARARAKLEAVKGTGDIGFYFLFENRLQEVWKALREATAEPADRRFGFTLGAGAPNLAALRLDRSPNDKAIALVSVDSGRETATWRWEWFKTNIIKKLREANVKEVPNWAQVYATYLRAKDGESCSQVGLTSLAAAAGGQVNKAFSVIANKQRMEIAVVVRGVKELRRKESREALIVLVNQAVRQLSVEGTTYKILKSDFVTALQGALDGPEGLGVEIPLIILVAYGQMRAATAPSTAPAGQHAGAGRFTFAVSDDKMEAKISGFAVALYDDPTIDLNVEYVQNELKRALFKQPMGEAEVKGLVDALTIRADLNGVVVLRGTAGSGGKGPRLHPSYKDAAGRVAVNLDSDDVDMRDLQQRATVTTGQLVAEIRYDKPPVPGSDVYGEPTPPPPADELIVRVGDGIQQREQGRFYAACDGMPAIEGESLSLTKQLVHVGDVNLRSGNIRFDGPVEIKGSIDNGAVVETTGDLIVEGTIRGGQVTAHGSITVKEGIVTGPKGKVFARGDLSAEFIENSNVTCGGHLTVTRVLISSSVICGGTIRVMQKSGIIAGGSIIAKESMYTYNLGFKNGATTKLLIGVDWKIARALEIRRGRLEKMQQKAQEDRQSLRELVQKSKAQMTARHKEMKEQLQDRLQRMRTLLEKLEALVQKAQSQLTYTATARIYIEEMLAANVNLQIAGQTVAVVNDVFNVAVVPKRRRGSYIVPLDEILAEERAEQREGKKGAQPSKKAG